MSDNTSGLSRPSDTDLVIVIHVAGRDLLRDEAIAYAEALRAAGVHTEMHIYRGLPHGFYTFMLLKETHLYFRRTVNFVVRCASGSIASTGLNGL